jgi:hypothetical protein
MLLELELELEKRLADIAPPTGLIEVLYQVVTSAESEGWIGDLVWAAARDSPHEPVLHEMALTVGPEHPRGIVVGDPASFDMVNHMTRVLTARYSATAKLVGFYVTDAEESFRRRLHERIAAEVEASAWDGLALDDSWKSAGELAKEVRSVLPTLRLQSMVVGIRVERTSTSSVEQFWSELGEGCETWANELVVVLAVDSTMTGELPDVLVELPRPSIEEEYLQLWVHQLVPAWPMPRKQRLVDAIFSRVHAAPRHVRWEELYNQLTKQINRLRDDLENAIKEFDGMGAV